MTFQQVIEELQRVRPGTELGFTAIRGQYYDQAIHMDFRRVDIHTYVAEGARGKKMWLYISQRFGKICCGNKS